MLLVPATESFAQQGWVIRKGLFGFRAKPFVAVQTPGACVSVGGGNGCAPARYAGGYSSGGGGDLAALEMQVRMLQLQNLSDRLDERIANAIQGHVDDMHGQSAQMIAGIQAAQMERMQAQQQAMQSYINRAAIQSQINAAMMQHRGAAVQAPGVSVQVPPAGASGAVLQRQVMPALYRY